MQRIITGKVNPKHYKARFVFTGCIDNRFSDPEPKPGYINLVKEFIKFKGKERFDPLEMPGGAKVFASPTSEFEKEYWLGALGDSISLHKPEEVCLWVHAACGKYGKSFDDPTVEQEFYFTELAKAEQVVNDYLKRIDYAAKVEKYYADWNGLIQV